MTQEQTKIHNALLAVWTTLVALQDHYFAQHNRYFQGIITHTTLPNGNAKRDGDFAKKPTDQVDDWTEFLRGKTDDGQGNISYLHASPVIAARLEYAIRIDVWDGPSGKGWVISVEYADNSGDHWKLQRFSDGSEIDWAIVEVEPND